MRHKGSVSQINFERDKFIVNVAIRKAKRMVAWPTNTMRICEAASEIEAPEFFISFDTAIYYIRDRYVRDREKRFRNSYKQRLYNALYARFLSLVALPANSSRTLSEVVEMALRSPAPHAGISPLQVYDILRHYKKTHRK